MAISYVGNTVGWANATTTYTIPLTSLVSGSNSLPTVSDVVVITAGWTSTSDGAPTITTAGYTGFVADQYANDTRDANACFAYKVMGATPDTTVVVAAANNATFGSSAVVQVWRGVSIVTVALPTSLASVRINGNNVWSRPIAPEKEGQIIVSGGLSTSDNTPVLKSGPSLWTNVVQSMGSAATMAAISMMATFTNPISNTTVVPPTWFGGETSTSDSAVGIVVALNPSAPPTTALNTPGDGGTVTSLTPTLNFTGTDVDTDAVEYEVQVDDATFPNTHALRLVSSSSQYASIADASQTGLDITDDLTIEFWIKIRSQPPTNDEFDLIYKNDYGTTQRAYALTYEDVSGVRRFRIGLSADGNTTNRDQVIWNYELTPNVWYHVAWVVDISQAAASENELYINGVSQGNGTVTQDGGITAIFNSNSAFGIGCGFNSGAAENFVNGNIDDVRVWNDIRTALEISSNYNVELTGTEANLVAYWKLNNGYLDETTNNNDLTATGSPVFVTDTPDFGPAPIVDAKSATDAGFTAGHPFASGAAKEYTLQSNLTDSTTYYWRARAIDPLGSNEWGAWTATRSFNVNTSAVAAMRTTGYMTPMTTFWGM